MTVSFKLETRIPASVDAVFDLALNIDAHVESMARSGERAIGERRTGLLGLDEEVTWRARHFGVSFTMTSRIVELNRPVHFVDEQVRGPFRRFRHEHAFRPDGAGSLMIDRVQFDAPLGPIGDLVERLVLRNYLVRLISERNEHLKTSAEASRNPAGNSSGPHPPDRKQ